MDRAPGLARSEILSPVSGFATAVVEIAAMQRGWRDFRIAQ
jgi:hypothetical protein